MKNLNGNTYPIKDLIKSKGGKWNAEMKCWSVPDDVYEELKKMIPEEKKLNLNGQLWQECPICDNEPVYISLGCICERCARKNYR